MIKNVIFWLNCSRAYALPITILSWLTVFVYSLKNGGNILNGLLALVGISLAHLAGNLADDYIDYGILSKDEKMMNSAVKSKCCFIRDGSVTLNDILKMIALYSAVALLIGVFLFFRSGVGVVGLVLISGILTLTYARFSLIGMSEVIIGLLFGPLMFEGVYYVMNRTFSLTVFVLSVAVVMFSLGFLYTHTLLDYDSDETSHKKTLCRRIGDKNKALILLVVFYIIGFAAITAFAFLTREYFTLIALFASPFMMVIINGLKSYNADKNFKPVIRCWNYPLDNWSQHIEDGTDSFFFVLYQARNFMLWICLCIIVGILL